MRLSFATAPFSGYLASGSRITAFAALLCGVHCALTPVLVLLAPALALSEGLERGVWLGTVLAGAVMIGLSPARSRLSVVSIFLAGATLWAASLAGWLEPLPEPLTSAVGSLTLAGGLLLSVRVCRTHACEACADEEEAVSQG